MRFVPNGAYMVCMGISDYFFNTEVLAYQQSGTLKMTLGGQLVSVADCEHRSSRVQETLVGGFVPGGRVQGAVRVRSHRALSSRAGSTHCPLRLIMHPCNSDPSLGHHTNVLPKGHCDY
jgi:hypothetical protein